MSAWMDGWTYTYSFITQDALQNACATRLQIHVKNEKYARKNRVNKSL